MIKNLRTSDWVEIYSKHWNIVYNSAINLKYV